MYCSIKPGITGPWQVTKRSDTEDYGERVQLDTWYVLNHSFWLDLQIIYKTIGCMIKGKGAY
ncbi:MAG: sugar transferase [Desulfobacterales bacterium]